MITFYMYAYIYININIYLHIYIYCNTAGNNTLTEQNILSLFYTEIYSKSILHTKTIIYSQYKRKYPYENNFLTYNHT